MTLTTRISSNNLVMLYGDTYYYLNLNAQGFSVYADTHTNPLYQLNEPILLVQGTAVSSQQIHLTFIKSNGELCYTLVNDSGSHQTTVLAKLEVRSRRYSRLQLIPIGSTVHIFYAHSHHAIPEVWHIEHLFWNGKSWRNTHLGEVVHPREPLYSVSLDSKKNLHLLMMTYQGSKSILLTNRFQGTFHLWGTSTEALTIPQEVLNVASLMTTSDTHHLFWIGKTVLGQLELGWAHRTEAQNLASMWIKAPAPIQTVKGPTQGIGVLEVNGCLWLLNMAEQETLLISKGNGWLRTAAILSSNQPLNISIFNEQNHQYTFWVADSQNPHLPAYLDEIGLTLKSKAAPTSHIQYNPAPDYVPLPEYTIRSEQTPLTSDQKGNSPKEQTTEKTPPLTNANNDNHESLNKEQMTKETDSHLIIESSKNINEPDLKLNSNTHIDFVSDFDDFNPDSGSDAIPVFSNKQNPAQTPSEFIKDSLEPLIKDSIEPLIKDSIEPLITESLKPILNAIFDIEEKNENLIKSVESIVSDLLDSKINFSKVEEQILNLEKALAVIKEENKKGFCARWFK